MNVNLGTHFEELVRSQVKTRRYKTASDFIRAVLRDWEDHQFNEIIIDGLEEKLQDGLDSGKTKIHDVPKILADLRRRRRQAAA